MTENESPLCTLWLETTLAYEPRTVDVKELLEALNEYLARFKGLGSVVQDFPEAVFAVGALAVRKEEARAVPPGRTTVLYAYDNGEIEATGPFSSEEKALNAVKSLHLDGTIDAENDSIYLMVDGMMREVGFEELTRIEVS